jgi:hypothetical protein
LRFEREPGQSRTPAARGSHEVFGVIDRHADEKRPQRRLGSEAPHRARQRHEHLLHELFGLIVFAGEASSKGAHGFVVVAIRFSQRELVAAQQPFDESIRLRLHGA